MIIKRFLIDENIALPYIKDCELLESQFLVDMNKIHQEVPPENVRPCMEKILVNHYKRIQKTSSQIVFDYSLAEGISSADVEVSSSFEPIMLWDVEVTIRRGRMFIEIFSTTQSNFPVKNIPSWMHLLADEEYQLLSMTEVDIPSS